MAICSLCNGRRERPCSYEGRTQEVYEASIKAIKHVAYRCGYAIAMHGSLKTDIDLIAVPWRDSCITAKSLAEEIKLTIERIIGTVREREVDNNPVIKSCGRLAWSFYTTPEGIDGPYFDISIMPRNGSPEDILA